MSEERIVWVDKGPYPYVRETEILLRSRARPPRRGQVPGKVVTYATLSRDARSQHPGMFLRRVWYVLDRDPYPGGPIEARDPSSVRPGYSEREVQRPLHWARAQKEMR
jgi:hypothetical protein